MRALYAGLTLCLAHTTLVAAPWSIEGKTGVFFPSSKVMRSIFDSTMPFVEVQGHCYFCPCWDAWGSVGCIFANGRSLCCHQKSSIAVVPLQLGVSRFFNLCNFEAFVGVGAMWSFYHNNDHSSSVIQHVRTSAPGAVVQAGVQRCITERMRLSLFTEYLYQRFSFHKHDPKHFTYRHDVDMSGFKLGLGLIYDF